MFLFAFVPALLKSNDASGGCKVRPATFQYRFGSQLDELMGTSRTWFCVSKLLVGSLKSMKIGAWFMCERSRSTPGLPKTQVLTRKEIFTEDIENALWCRDWYELRR